ncbi:cyanophycin synthetase [Thalassoporum mexicanum PCC 7367]|uniref:cyanophycin synthetase n=1 Tax=Thalassoporum mexicanum TaxID=3457544 RepID=UPI00029F8E32|nr:cyanophycin synthetase [Pseudanabaena sp. PCC 7367]AFY69199.1 cyanophycin synthetase [Pseudanabaena sp. PCC 7367]
MKILKIQTLRGPNRWSIDRHKLVVIRLDLEDALVYREDVLELYDNICADVLPSLKDSALGRSVAEGENIVAAELVQHIALELQRLAGMPVEYSNHRPTVERNVFLVVLEYVHELAGRYAARAAVRLCQSMIEDGVYPDEELKQDLVDLTDLRLDAQLGPSTESIVAEARARNIPYIELGTRAMLQLGFGVHQKRIQATLSNRSSLLGVELACDKEGTKRILRDSGVPVPRGTVISSIKYLDDAIADVGGFPIVVKPLNGNHGRGISIDVRTYIAAEDAFDLAQEVSNEVIIERYHPGRDHRVLVVNSKLVAVSERVPAHVIGDGKATIAELIEITNQDSRRGEGHDNVLTKIELNSTSYDVLQRQGYDLDTIPKAGQTCYLRATANLSTGGIAVDRTDDIHPENVWLAQRVAQIVGLDIAGIDIVTSDITQPLRATDGVIVEVNAAPGFRMHTSPSIGIPRNVAEPVIDMLFANGAPARIPIISITGTNGKTTTTRLTAHIFKQTQQTVGYTTTDGIYVGDWLVEKGDTTGPYSAQVILRDPTVEVAVLETARGGILRSGLGFDGCDVGMVLNVQADHLGIGDIETVEDLADLKSVVAKAVVPSGYAVLNADDPLVSAMAKDLRAQVAYFSMDPENPIVKEHTEQGGLAAVYENGYLSILKGDWTLRIEQAVNVPITLGGRTPFMIQNALAASLAAFVQGVQIEVIRDALNSFVASAKQTPGRMNLFNLGRFHVLLDYAHNPAGYKAIADFINTWNGDRIGVIGAPGDRRDEDFVELGKLSAEMFDRILIKEDNDRRGRNEGEVAALFEQGIKETNPKFTYEVTLDEVEALNSALDRAADGSLIVIFPEKVERAIEIIESRQPPELRQSDEESGSSGSAPESLSNNAIASL